MRAFDFIVGNVGDDEVLPGSEAEVAVAELVGDVGDLHHGVDEHASDGNDDTEVVVAIALAVGADVAVFDFGLLFFAKLFGEVAEREGKLLFGFLEELGDAPVVDEIFETGFFAVGAVAVFKEDAQDGGSDGDSLLGGEKNAGVGGELLVSGDAAELHPEVDAGVEVALGFGEPDSVEGDVVGVGTDRDRAAGVEGDIELARETVEVAVVHNVVVHRLGEGEDVDEFVWIESSGGRGGDVAHVIGSGATGSEAELGELGENVDRVLWLDFADLDVAAGRDVAVAAAPVAGDFAESAELSGVEGAAGNAGAQHVGVLSRGDVEEAVEFEAKDVAVGGEGSGCGVGKEGVVGIKAVLFVLDRFLAAEVIDGRAKDGFFNGFGGVMGELTVGVLAKEGQGLLDSSDEAIEVSGLFVGEWRRWRRLHLGQRNSVMHTNGLRVHS